MVSPPPLGGSGARGAAGGFGAGRALGSRGQRGIFPLLAQIPPLSVLGGIQKASEPCSALGVPCWGAGGTGLRSGAGTAHPSSISPQGPPGGGGPPGTPIMPSPAGRSPNPVPKASPASPGRVFGGARCHSCRGGAAAQAAAAPSPSAF